MSLSLQILRDDEDKEDRLLYEFIYWTEQHRPSLLDDCGFINMDSAAMIYDANLILGRVADLAEPGGIPEGAPAPPDVTQFLEQLVANNTPFIWSCR